MTRYPLRRVVRSERKIDAHNRHRKDSAVHFLECGHRVSARHSKGYPKRKYCWECARGTKKEEVMTWEERIGVLQN